MVAVIEMNVARFSVRFDGPITTEHHLSVRSMARTYEHIQRAIDRSYLIGKYGAVWKHARLSAPDYKYVDFIAAYPQEGSIILDAFKRGVQVPGEIIDRIATAMTEPFERALQRGFDENASLRQQLAQRRQYVQDIGVGQVPMLQRFVEEPPKQWAENYSKRSILKEVDQLVSQITPRELNGSSVDVSLFGNAARAVYKFTPEVASRFHDIVAERDLGPVVQVNVRIRDLDRGNKYSRPKAKVYNIDSGREASLHLSGDADFQSLHPYHTFERVSILAAPYLEAGGFDLNGGDLVFVDVIG